MQSCVKNDSCESVVGVLDQVASDFGRSQHPEATAALALCRWNMKLLFEVGWDGTVSRDQLAAAHVKARDNTLQMAEYHTAMLQKYKESTLNLFSRQELRDLASELSEVPQDEAQKMLKQPLVSLLSQNFDDIGLTAAQIAGKKGKK